MVRLVPNQKRSIAVTAVSLRGIRGPHNGVPVKRYIQAAPAAAKTNRIINALRMHAYRFVDAGALVLTYH